MRVSPAYVPLGFWSPTGAGLASRGSPSIRRPLSSRVGPSTLFAISASLPMKSCSTPRSTYWPMADWKGSHSGSASEPHEKRKFSILSTLFGPPGRIPRSLPAFHIRSQRSAPLSLSSKKSSKPPCLLHPERPAGSRLDQLSQRRNLLLLLSLWPTTKCRSPLLRARLSLRRP